MKMAFEVLWISILSRLHFQSCLFKPRYWLANDIYNVQDIFLYIQLNIWSEKRKSKAKMQILLDTILQNY